MTAPDPNILEISRLQKQRDELQAECERLTKRGPLWMQYGLAKLHSMVDLTDPNDVIGRALTCAGFQRVVVVDAGEAQAIEDDRDSLRSQLAAAQAENERLLANETRVLDLAFEAGQLVPEMGAVQKVKAMADELGRQDRQIADLTTARDRLQEERDGLRAALTAAERELERWRHGNTIEGDFVCPNALRAYDATRERDEARDWTCPRCGPREMDAERIALEQDRDRLRAECERMRAVFEAAVGFDALETAGSSKAWEALDRLRDAIDSALQGAKEGK